MERHREAARVLHESTLRLNQTLERAEKALSGLHLGVNARIQIETHKPGWKRFLSFQKDGHEWKLMIHTGPEDGTEEMQETPLIHTSRASRAGALQHLPKLMEALVCAAEEQAKIMELEMGYAEAFISTLERGVAR